MSTASSVHRLTTIRKLFSATIALLTVSIALTSCTTKSETAQSPVQPESSPASTTPETIRIGYVRWGLLPIVRQQGNLEQELAKQNIKVQWVGPFPAFAPVLEAFNAGEIDIARQHQDWKNTQQQPRKINPVDFEFKHFVQVKFLRCPQCYQQLTHHQSGYSIQDLHLMMNYGTVHFASCKDILSQVKALYFQMSFAISFLVHALIIRCNQSRRTLSDLIGCFYTKEDYLISRCSFSVTFAVH